MELRARVFSGVQQWIADRLQRGVDSRLLPVLYDHPFIFSGKQYYRGMLLESSPCFPALIIKVIVFDGDNF